MSALIGIEAFASAPFLSPGTGGLEAGSGALADESAFELCESSEDVEDEASAARIGVDGLLETPEADVSASRWRSSVWSSVETRA